MVTRSANDDPCLMPHHFDLSASVVRSGRQGGMIQEGTKCRKEGTNKGGGGVGGVRVEVGQRRRRNNGSPFAVADPYLDHSM
jgi:hypothetical protein